jgi:hypothetical protein
MREQRLQQAGTDARCGYKVRSNRIKESRTVLKKSRFTRPPRSYSALAAAMEVVVGNEQGQEISGSGDPGPQLVKFLGSFCDPFNGSEVIRKSVD